MQYSRMRSALGAFAVVGLASMSLPSDPVAVYAVIDRVVVSPDTVNPTTIQIWGKFAVGEQRAGDKYGPAVKGYLHYRLSPGSERAARAEWNDLRAVAGTNVLVGFGSKFQSLPVGRVRCATEAATSPDLYPVANSVGVVKIPQQRNVAWPVAKDLLSGKVTDAPCTANR